MASATTAMQPRAGRVTHPERSHQEHHSVIGLAQQEPSALHALIQRSRFVAAGAVTLCFLLRPCCRPALRSARPSLSSGLFSRDALQALRINVQYDATAFTRAVVQARCWPRCPLTTVCTVATGAAHNGWDGAVWHVPRPRADRIGAVWGTASRARPVHPLRWQGTAGTARGAPLVRNAQHLPPSRLRGRVAPACPCMRRARRVRRRLD